MNPKDQMKIMWPDVAYFQGRRVEEYSPKDMWAASTREIIKYGRGRKQTHFDYLKTMSIVCSLLMALNE